MNAVVVGADRLGNIPLALSKLGVRVMQHVSGRDAAHQRKLPSLPKGTELLILFTDFVGHNVMRHFRCLAREQAVPVVACKRSLSCLTKSVECCLAGCKIDPTGAACPGKQQQPPSFSPRLSALP